MTGMQAKKSRLMYVLFVALGGVWTPAPAAVRFLQPNDIYNVQAVSDPQVSSDGDVIAYVVTLNDRATDRQVSSIWTINWDGSHDLALSRGMIDAVMPRWSPNGRYLAFVATPPGAANRQIMILDRRGGEAAALTDLKSNIEGYSWSPDGNRLVLSVDRSVEDPKKVGLAPTPIVIGSSHFKQDGTGYLAPALHAQLLLVDVLNKRTRELTPGTMSSDSDPVWSPDGRHIAYISVGQIDERIAEGEELMVIDAGGESRSQIVTKCDTPNEQQLAWSADGKLLAYKQGAHGRFIGYSQDQLFVISPDGGIPRSLTATLDRAVIAYAFASDSLSIYIAEEDNRNTYAAYINLTSGATKRATEVVPEVVSALSEGGGHVVLLKSSDHAPAEIFALEGARERKLTSHNDAWLAGVELGAVADIQFRSRDGTDIDGLMIYPPHYRSDIRYPAVIWIHGGPNTQDDHSFVLDGYQFEHQMFAAEGFVVLAINYRGSAGRGGAFARAIFADWGHKEVEDILSGAEFLKSLHIVDMHQLGIGGWSYGGILTDYTVASDSRFAAGISGAGSGNPSAMYGTDQFAKLYDVELGPPWEDTNRWLKLSYPFFHADRIRTPVLFLGGMNDFDVPIAGSEQMYQALRTLGVPTKLVIYPDQYHLITRPSFILDLESRMSSWYKEFLSGEH